MHLIAAFACPFCGLVQGWGGAMRMFNEKKKQGETTYLCCMCIIIVVTQKPIVPHVFVFAGHSNALGRGQGKKKIRKKSEGGHTCENIESC